MKKRQAAAGEEVLQLFGRMTEELQEEVAHLHQDNERQRRQLMARLNPVVLLHRAGWCVSHYECRKDAVWACHGITISSPVAVLVSKPVLPVVPTF